ncbi:hypothetical protein COS75_03015 [Candidatus Pacearchaeota archaeon CG06_land_8_20_14_3_00_35_12]|nr:MAG: hypothetical protein COS75_03015 [Candidatus Pacearchaeota archaeon CG06_land_8_20_14_3_00_35_12]
MKMAKKTLGLFFVFLTAVLTVMTAVSALDNVANFGVEVRGQSLSGTVLSVSRGETLPVHIVFQAVGDGQDIQVSAEIKGYRRAITDETARFDVIDGVTYDKYVYLKIPSDISANDDYLLNIEVTAKDFVYTQSYTVELQRNSYTLEVLSVETPSVVAAGKTLTANIVVKNRGSHDAEDVYVKASIPELGVEKTVYAGDLLNADSEHRDDTVEKTIALVVPSSARKGTYNLVVEAYNADTSVTKQKAITVDGVGETTATEILLKEVSKKVEQGKSTAYELTLVNLAETSQSYSIDVEGADGWAVVQTNPADLTLAKEASQSVTVYLTVSSAATIGQHNLIVNVKSGNTMLKQVNLVAEVQRAGEINALTISAIVLAIILVVLIVALVMIKGQGSNKVSDEEVSYY